MHILTTRPSADSMRLKARLEAASYEVSVAPLLKIEVDRTSAIPKGPWQAILVTSANALSALDERGISPQLKRAPVVAVGPASAARAEELGFSSISQADGSGLDALVDFCLTTLDAAAGPLLYISGKTRSGDLAKKLSLGGFDTTLLELYDAVPAASLPEDVEASLQLGGIDGVVLYSPRTAKIWTDLTNGKDLRPHIDEIVHFCLSENVAGILRDRPGRDFQIAVASDPNDDAMLACIAKVSADYDSKGSIPGNKIEMANQKKPASKAAKKTRPKVIDAEATEVTASEDEGVAESAGSSPCKPTELNEDKSDTDPSGKDKNSATSSVEIAGDEPETATSDGPGETAKMTATAASGSGKGKLITGALLATLLAGVVGGGYLYREHGQKLFGGATPSIDVGAIEGQAIEAIGAAQSASNAASSALTETKALAEKLTSLEQRLDAASDVVAKPDEQTLAAIAAAAETANAAKSETASLDKKTSEISTSVNAIKQSVEGLKQALESAAKSGGSIDQADLNLKIGELDQRLTGMEGSLAEQKVSSQNTLDLKPLQEQLAAANERIEALEAKLTELAAASVSAVKETPAGIDTAAINNQLTSIKSTITSGKPFERELTSLETTMGAPLGLPALTANAAKGVQTLEQLKTSLAELDIKPPAAPSTQPEDSGIWGSLAGKLSSVVKVRKLSDSDWPDRVLRARAAIDETGLAGAVSALDTGKEAAAVPDTISAWLIEARRHLEVDRALQQLPQTVLGRLPAPAQ